MSAVSAPSEFYESVSFHHGSKTGVLILHGFMGAPGRVRPIGERLNEAGFDVEVPLLAGRGTDWRAWNQATWRDWADNAEAALNKLNARCDTVIVGGLSMGGVLALHLAARRPDIKGLFLINHALFLVGGRRLSLFIPIIRFIIPSFPSGQTDIKDRSSAPPVLKRAPLHGVHQLLNLMKTVRSELDRVKQPTLILKSIHDHVVPNESALYTVRHIASQNVRLVWLENSYHVAPLDFDKDLIGDNILEFIASFSRED